MISGHDIVIQTNRPSEIAEEILKLIKVEWNQMVIEDANTGDEIQLSIPGFHIIPKEFFVYENPEKKRLWDNEGAYNQNRNSMFHVLLQQQQITAVVDDPSEITTRNVIQAAQALSRDLHLFSNLQYN